LKSSSARFGTLQIEYKGLRLNAVAGMLLWVEDNLLISSVIVVLVIAIALRSAAFVSGGTASEAPSLQTLLRASRV
jgi:hypothetical protein